MLEKIIDIIVENLGVDRQEVVEDARLVEDLGADSLDAVEISMAIEDEFDIEIPDDKLEDLVTVADIVKAVEDQS